MFKPAGATFGAILLCVLALPALAQDFTDEQLAEALDFADSNSVMVLYHEIGHLLVGELNLPVLGKNEDAADSLSALLLLEEPEGEWADVVLRDAANGWYLSPFNGDEVPGDWAFMGEHSLDKQRAYFFVCMMVGAKPDYYAELAEEWGLDEDRRSRCGSTFAQAQSSWHTVLEPHLLGDGTPAGQIAVTYEDAGDYERFAEALKASSFLESAAALVTDNYVIPRDLVFRAEQCGEANAFYSPSQEAVIFCYEYMAKLSDLYLADLSAPSEGNGEDEAGEETTE